jgi:hypothetical protein
MFKNETLKNGPLSRYMEPIPREMKGMQFKLLLTEVRF